MPILINGTNLLQLCEWGGGAAKHAIASSGLLLGGQTLSAAGRAPVSTQSIYSLYSGDTYTPTGLLLRGKQVVLQKPGYRPYRKQLFSYSNNTYSNVTFSLTSNVNGEVYINGEKKGKKIIDWNTTEDLPRGPCILTVALVSGGGGGGAAGIASSYNNNGGSGGAVIMAVRITMGQTYSITVGCKGQGKGGIGADGVNGGTSSAFGVSITGGGGANGGSNNAPRQTATVSGAPASPSYIISQSGGSDTTTSSTLSAAFPIPESGGNAVSGPRYGGAAGSGSGYGSGGDGNPGSIIIWY